MNSFCGILDIRSTELDFDKLKSMGTALMAYGSAKSAEAFIDKGLGIFTTGEILAKSTPTGELYLALGTPDIETSVSANELSNVYLSSGYDTPSALDGCFAFALLDRRRRELLIATDPIAAKPVFLCKDGEKILVSTSIAPLLRYSPTYAEVDRSAVLELVRAPDGEVSATDIYKNVSELGAGHFMIFSGLGAQILRYKPKVPSPVATPQANAKNLSPDKHADLKKCAEHMTAALGYPSFDEYTPEYVSAIRSARDASRKAFIAKERQSLSFAHLHRKLYALGDLFGVSVALVEAPEELHLKRSFLHEREKKLSEIVSTLLASERSHVRRIFGRSLETIVSRESDISARIGILGKIIGLEHWLETYPIVPI